MTEKKIHELKTWPQYFKMVILANYSPTSKCEGSEACGESSEPRKVQRTSKKQELSNLIID